MVNLAGQPESTDRCPKGKCACASESARQFLPEIPGLRPSHWSKPLKDSKFKQAIKCW